MWADLSRPERIERILGRVEKGQSFSYIAAALGCSREAVAGYVYRYGADTPEVKQGRVERQRASEARSKSRAEKKPRPRTLVKPIPVKRTFDNTRPAWEPLPGSTPTALEDLERTQCRWPLGDSPYRFCGCPAETSRSYCAEHLARAFVPRVPKSRRVE